MGTLKIVRFGLERNPGLWSVQNREFLLYIHWFAVVASQALC